MSDTDAEEFLRAYMIEHHGSVAALIGRRVVCDILKAYAESLAGTQAQSEQWISVNDKLPEMNARILTWCVGKQSRILVNYRKPVGEGWVWNVDPNVALWQPLPVAPMAALEGKP